MYVIIYLVYNNEITNMDEYIDLDILQDSCKKEIKFLSTESDCYECFNLSDSNHYFGDKLVLIDEIDNVVYRSIINKYEIKNIEVLVENKELYITYDGIMFIINITPEQFYNFHKNAAPSEIRLYDGSIFPISDIVSHILSLYNHNYSILHQRYQESDPINTFKEYPIYNNIHVKPYEQKTIPFDIKEHQIVPNVGDFICYTNYTIRIIFKNDCILRMNNNTDIISLILPSGETFELPVDAAYIQYPKYVKPALEFKEWAIHTPEERKKLVDQKIDEEKRISQVMEENRQYILKNSEISSSLHTYNTLNKMSSKQLFSYIDNMKNDMQKYLDNIDNEL